MLCDGISKVTKDTLAMGMVGPEVEDEAVDRCSCDVCISRRVASRGLA